MIPNILSIAGSDPSGGAGIQADLKTIGACGGYGMSAITALTAQNTQGVTGVHIPPVDFLRAQLDAISDDIRIHAIKVGMAANEDVIGAIREWLDSRPEFTRIPIVIDPVMISTSGARLLDEQAMRALLDFLPYATVITPNLPELAVIAQWGWDTTTHVANGTDAVAVRGGVTQDNRVQHVTEQGVGSQPCEEPAGCAVPDLDEGVALAQRWQQQLAASSAARAIQPPAVVVKGGHLSGKQADNVLVRADGSLFTVECARVQTSNTHGTGCSLSSAIATKLATTDLDQAVAWSTAWLRGAIAAGEQLNVGQGHGPVHHFYRG